MDEHVAPVEALLSRNATQVEIRSGLPGPAYEVEWALWLCPCYSELDAPTWLLLHDAGGLGWSRVPDEVDVETVVASEQMAGWHTETFAVLQWLTGEAGHPWLDGDEGAAHQQIVDFFANALHSPRPAR